MDRRTTPPHVAMARRPHLLFTNKKRGWGGEPLMVLELATRFARRGYRHIDRDAAPAPLQDTAEFKSLCPEGAVCMVKDI